MALARRNPAAALRLRDLGQRRPDALLLAYPFAHFPNPALDADTRVEMEALPPLLRFTTEGIESMVRNYVGRLSDLPPSAMPGAADLRGLPATAIVVAEYDDLRPSGELLERQLAEVGVGVRSYLAAGMTHGHLNRNSSLGEVDRSLDFLAAVLADGAAAPAEHPTHKG
ncbi:alpha/beta hydrolase fold domain-containing protein [Kitasatospora sp. NPDC098652]|uniref:alpha/beta hydrolase fold domain-containing protein n=1 Tax=Kitasatospora sp. NPDC098652 TaxID=3364095 RepID=UPI0037F741F3